MSTISLKAEFGIWFLNLVCTKLCVCSYCDQKTLSLFDLSRVSHSSGSGLCLYIFIRKMYFLFYFEHPRLFAGTPAMWIIFVLCLYKCLNIKLDSSGYQGFLHILLLIYVFGQIFSWIKHLFFSAGQHIIIVKSIVKRTPNCKCFKSTSLICRTHFPNRDIECETTIDFVALNVCRCVDLSCNWAAF